MFGKLRWFQGKSKEKEEAQRKEEEEARRKEEEEAQRVLLEEFQGLRKLLRKQSVLIEEVRREQEQALSDRERRNTESFIELCDAVFHLQRAFQNPGLMSRQHAQVLNMVFTKVHRFAASLGLEMILEEGVPFDSRIHEAVSNRDPGSHALEVVEVVQPGYLQNARVLRSAKVIVGAADDLSLIKEGVAPS